MEKVRIYLKDGVIISGLKVLDDGVNFTLRKTVNLRSPRTNPVLNELELGKCRKETYIIPRKNILFEVYLGRKSNYKDVNTITPNW